MTRQDRFTQQAQEVLAASQELVRQQRHSQWDVEHVFLALLQHPDGLAGQVLERAGVDVGARRGGARGDTPTAESRYGALEKYAIDLTEAARQGKLDPVIGREPEIKRVMQILNRRTKNNPVIIGDPGVGKTAVVEGLAQKIVADDVPQNIKGKRLLALDMGALVAGSQMPGGG